MNEPEPAPAPRRPRRRLPRPLRWLLWTLASLIFAFLVALWAIDTGPGHRFIADRIASLPIKSGLRIRVGRIDGSIWGRAVLRDLRLYDPQGLFLEAPEVRLDWRPTRWLADRLDIRSLSSDLVVLHRLPKLRDTGRQGPILPGFDVTLGRLDVAALRVEPAVAGRRRVVRLGGRADIRSGRALIDLRAAAYGGGDRLALHLDAEPDQDRFDLELRLAAPADSLVGGLAGTRRPIRLVATGTGTWARWDGRAAMDLSDARVAGLALAVREGRFLLEGNLAPSRFLQGKLQRLTAPRVAVRAEGMLADRRLSTRLSLDTPALTIAGRGVVDLARSGFDGVRLNLALRRPAAMFPNMSGSPVRLDVDLDGPFRTAAFAYRLAGRRIVFDQTGFEDVRATGAGRLSGWPLALPVRLRARRVTGVGDVVGGILRNLDIAGTLAISPAEVRGRGISLSSDKLKGRLALFLDLATGRYDVTLSGGLQRYLIPGLGIVDVTSDLSVVPDPGGAGTRVEGRGRAWVRRLDNGFLASLAGGLPAIDTRLVRGRDGVIRFSGLRLTGPAIAISGNGYRRRDGTFFFEGSGRQGSYGPFRMVLDGNISRPRLQLALDAPVPALGVAAVRLDLDPDAQGFAYRAQGGSTLGPFTSIGRIDLPPGAAALIRVASLAVSGTNAAGRLRSDPGGFTGRLDVGGGGLTGALLFSPDGEVQRIEGHLAADGARLTAATPIAVRRGRIDGVIRLDPAGVGIQGTIAGRGLRRGAVSLARLDATARLRGGSGTVKGSVAGSRGRSFAIDLSADLAPDRVTLAAQGTLDRRPIRLVSPARLAAEGEGWRLQPTRLAYGGGEATVAGRFGGADTDLDATLATMPLSALDIFYPNLGLGGTASGTLAYRQDGDAAPTGLTDLRVRGLTRSGLVLSSRPVDVGLAAVLGPGGAGARAVVVSGGQVIGRAQARLRPLPTGGGLAARLAAAPLFAQLRYTGPVDTLWRLTGVETIDLSGPVAIGADMRGTLANPQIRGSLRTDGARLESAVTGTVVTGIAAAGRFNGSRLVIDSFQGATAGDGAVSGSGAFDLAGPRGLAMTLAIDARRAVLLARDDIGATVTGPLAIRSDGSGGTISGEVDLVRSRFRLGRATAAAAVPRLAVREINRPADEVEEGAPAAPWRLDLKARARNRLMVRGLGLDSEWRTDLAIRGTVDNPAITGRADLIRGNYEFAGRRFDLDRGAIRFLGEAPPDPVLDIVAQANIQGLNATIRVAGTGLRPDISFQSTPALPEDELLSRLLFGSSITNLSAPEALQLAAAVASLQGGGGGGLNPINAVRRVAGLDRLRILPAEPALGIGTQVAAGKYLGRKTYVEVISDGAGYSATRVEFQVTRWLSLLSSISTIGRQSANVRVSRDY